MFQPQELMVTCPDIDRHRQHNMSLAERAERKRAHGMGMWSLYLRARRPGRDDDIGKSPGKTNRIPEAEKGADMGGRRVFEDVGTGEH